MGLQPIFCGSLEGDYQRLNQQKDEVAVRPRRRWLRKLNGRVVALRLSSSKRLTWRCLSSIKLPRRLLGLYDEIKGTVKPDDVVSPTIVFSSPWGLPMLSHSSFVHRRG